MTTRPNDIEKASSESPANSKETSEPTSGKNSATTARQHIEALSEQTKAKVHETYERAVRKNGELLRRLAE
jgi:hypothetical protein